MKNQLKLFESRSSTAHGGAAAKGKRKAARPLVTKSPMHFTFKSSRAKGAWSLHRHGDAIEKRLRELAKKFRVRVRLFQNVGNHLHLAVQGATRRELQNFLRVFPQAVMFLVTGAKKGNPVGKFWDALTFSRVVHWGRDWESLRIYFEANEFEAAGLPRKAYADLRARMRAELEAAWKGS